MLINICNFHHNMFCNDLILHLSTHQLFFKFLHWVVVFEIILIKHHAKKIITKSTKLHSFKKKSKMMFWSV